MSNVISQRELRKHLERLSLGRGFDWLAMYISELS